MLPAAQAVSALAVGAAPEPPTQTPTVVVVVVTATPSADTPSSGGCGFALGAPAGTAVGNLLLMAAPLGIIGGVKWSRRRKR